MRLIVLSFLTASGIAALGIAPAAAVGTRYPFCIQGEEYMGLSNCGFESYEQCQATASGRNLSCIANPYYVGGSNDRRSPRRSRGRPPGLFEFPDY